jgi:NADPH:quinone reductase
MKAIRVHEYGGPERLQWEEVPDPQPGPGQVVVRIAAAGVNPVDTYIRSGSYAIKVPLPYTPGGDAAGTVHAIGSGVTGLAVGDRVYLAGSLSGTYAEMALAEASRVHPLPENVTFEQGAAVNVPYATAYRALHQRAQARPGETLLVHGASGGVGIAAVQLGVAHGMRVIGTAGTEEGQKLVAEQGAQEVLDHRAPDNLERLLQLTDGRGVDVVLETHANVNLGKDLTVLAAGGRVVVIGSRGTVEINPRDAMTRDAAILGMLLNNATPAEVAGIHAALGAGLRSGTLRPVVGRSFPMAYAPRAHEAVMAPGARGKIVLVNAGASR